MPSDKTWFIIINPLQGNGRAGKIWPKISQALNEAGIDHEHAFTKRRKHASVLARDAVRRGYRRLVSVGGDGTNNEVANGIMFQKIVHQTN